MLVHAAGSPTPAGLVAPPSGYAGPPRPAQGVAYRPAAAHSAVSAATYAYRNQFSEVSAGVIVQERRHVRSVAVRL